NWANVLKHSGNDPSGGFLRAGAAHADGGVQMVGLADAGSGRDLWHFMRTGNLWQQPIKIRDTSRVRPPKVANPVACVAIREDLHVVVASEDGSLWHTMRHAGIAGWQSSFVEITSSANAGTRAPVTSVTCRAVADTLQVITADNGPHAVMATT